jgi:hypothetical protein
LLPGLAAARDLLVFVGGMIAVRHDEIADSSKKFASFAPFPWIHTLASNLLGWLHWPAVGTS